MAERNKYQSPRMIERRRRILETTLELLSENDGNFTMRDLARRSDVALGTLYNLFGNQDSLVAEAVADVFSTRVEKMVVRPVSDNLQETVLAWHDAAYKEIMRIPAFAKAMVRVYFNSEPDSSVREMLHAIPTSYAQPRLEQALADGEFHDWVDPKRLADQVTVSSYAVIARWAADQIDDSELYDSLLYLRYMFIVGGVRGPTHALFVDALKALDGKPALEKKGKRA